jgi:DNA-binding NtrC family response regulator
VRILIVDDDAAVCASLRLLLKQAGFEPHTCGDPDAVLARLDEQPFGLLLQDMNFSAATHGQEGLRLLQAVKARHPSLPVLLMTAWGSIELAVQGVKAGAAHFVAKPWDNAQLLELVRTTLDLLAPAAHPTRASLPPGCDFSGIVGEHPSLLKVLATVAQVARTRAPVLILGESGTGKELIADALHRNSERRAAPLLKVNIGAVTPSLFESELFGHVRGAFTDARTERKGHFAAAAGGTLFLDEIGELGRPEQAKLLRVLQDGSFQPVGASRTERADVRIVSATNRELGERVASGAFREDLFYRLNLITLRLPPLRERRSDIPALARHILAQVSSHYGRPPVTLTPTAEQWLGRQPWPGNIRQLRQTLERTVLLSGKVELGQADIEAVEQGEPPTGRAPGLEGLTLDQVERHMVIQAMAQHQGNITQAAKALGLSRTAMYRRLQRHGLAVDAVDGPELSEGPDDAEPIDR